MGAVLVTPTTNPSCSCMARAGEEPSPSTLNSVMATRADIAPPCAEGGASGRTAGGAPGTGVTGDGAGAEPTGGRGWEAGGEGGGGVVGMGEGTGSAAGAGTAGRGSVWAKAAGAMPTTDRTRRSCFRGGRCTESTD